MTAMTKRWRTVLGCAFVVAFCLFWLARPGGESTTAIVAKPLAATTLADSPAHSREAPGSESPLSTVAPSEPNGHRASAPDRIAEGDGRVSPNGGTVSEPSRKAKSTNAEDRDRAWWDDVQRWRYLDAARPDLRGRDFGGAELHFVDLANADLRGANLEDANLHRADLRGANLQGAIVKRTYLYGAVLRDAVLRGTEIGPANIAVADLRGADLRDVRIVCEDCSTWSLLDGSNLNGADLRGAHLGSSVIQRSAFEEADLRGANLAETEGMPRSLRGALYDRHTVLPERIDPEIWEMVYVPDEDSVP